jgi:hypothetical protein
VERVCNHFYNGNITMHSLCFVEQHVAVNNVKIMTVTQCFFDDFMWPAAINVLRSSYKVPDILSDFNQMWIL